MLEPGHRLRLAAEPLGERLVVEELGGQDLERDAAVEAGLMGAVDGGHAPAAQRLHVLVGSKGRPVGEGQARASCSRRMIPAARPPPLRARRGGS